MVVFSIHVPMDLRYLITTRKQPVPPDSCYCTLGQSSLYFSAVSFVFRRFQLIFWLFHLYLYYKNFGFFIKTLWLEYDIARIFILFSIKYVTD